MATGTTDTGSTTAAAPAALVWAALGVVYVVWGSTYLAIRVMIRDLPPLFASGTRFVVAATLLGTFLRLRLGPGGLRVTRPQLFSCVVLGVLLPAVGNGLVALGERTVPSGIAALLVAVVPLVLVLLRSASGDRPRAATWVGVLVGFAGLAVLVLPSGGAGDASPLGVALILIAASAWAVGSWLQPRLTVPDNAFVATAYGMLAGGLTSLVWGFVAGEASELSFGEIGAASIAAWIYLVLVGSVVAFSAYVWLLRSAPLSLVSTYAYVNPVVAVLLGWVILSEPITATVVAGGAIIVVGVAVVVSAERLRPAGEVGAGESDGPDRELAA
jgi:drug/metabolite transporter (DMT)-like permease